MTIINSKIRFIKSKKVKKGKVKQEKIQNIIKKSINCNEVYYALAHKTHEVLVGEVRQGKIQFYNSEGIEPEHLLELRIFNKSYELHVIKVEDGYIWRERKDDDGEDEVEVYDEKHAILGTSVVKVGDHWVRLEEERGTKIYLPFSANSFNNTSKSNKIYYLVRNYISDEVLIKFEDARLFGFYIEKGVEYSE